MAALLQYAAAKYDAVDLEPVEGSEVCSSFSKSYTTQHTLAPFLPLSALLLGAPRLGFAQ